jgi:hypothetical protein
MLHERLIERFCIGQLKPQSHANDPSDHHSATDLNPAATQMDFLANSENNGCKVSIAASPPIRRNALHWTPPRPGIRARLITLERSKEMIKVFTV